MVRKGLGVQLCIRIRDPLADEKDMGHQEIPSKGLHGAQTAHLKRAEVNIQLQSLESLVGNADAGDPSELKTDWFHVPCLSFAGQEHFLEPEREKSGEILGSPRSF